MSPSRTATEPPADRLHEALLWVALLGLVGAIVALQAGTTPPDTSGVPADDPELQLQARYLVGAGSLLRDLGDAVPGSTAPDTISQLADGIDDLGSTPRHRLALVPALVELGEGDRAREILEALREEGQREDSNSSQAEGYGRGPRDDVPENFLEDLAAFEGLLAVPPRLPESQTAQRIRATYGWLGELALAREGPERAQRLREARRVALGLFGVAGLGLLLLAVGFVLAIAGFTRWRQGGLSSAYLRRQATLRDVAGPPARARALESLGALEAPGTGASPSPPHPVGVQDPPIAPERPDRRLPYLETLLVFLVALQLLAVVGLGLSHWFGEGLGLSVLLVNWLALPVVFWARARGRDRREVRTAVGWHRGAGIVREIGAGLLAYVAALPFLALALGVTLGLSQVVEKAPYHPIIDWARDPGRLDLVVLFLIAVVWAPLVEEAIFRGAFYHYLRGRFRPLAAALIVAALFAGIHPQGLLGLPVLVTLAVALALVREWRGSITAPVTMHCVHNGAAVTLLLLLTQ